MRKSRMGIYIGMVLMAVVFSSTQLFGQNHAERFNAQSPVYERVRRLTLNPTAFSLMPLQKDIQAGIGLNRGNSDDKTLHSIFDGDEFSFFDISAKGYKSDLFKSVVSGFASYQAGVKRNTAWSDVADTELFYPYLVADSIGGDYHSENYKVGASYAHKIGKMQVGGGINYRGAVHYRKIDPRPINNVSEIEFVVGALYPVKSYYLGINVGYLDYKQTMSSSSLKEDRKDKYFSMRGFGLYDYRLTDVGSNYSRYFLMDEWSAGLQLAHKENKNWLVNLNLTRQKVTTSEGSVRIPSIVNRFNPEMEVSYLKEFGKNRLLVSLNAGMTNSKGIENQYDTVIVHRNPTVVSYKLNYSAMKHMLSSYNLAASVLYECQINSKNAVWISPVVNYHRHDEKYVYPEYRLYSDAVDFALKTGYRMFFRKSWASAIFSKGKKFPLKNELLMPSDEQLTQKMTLHQYVFLTAGYRYASAKIDYYIPIPSKQILVFSLYGQIFRNIKCKKVTGIALSLLF